MDLSCIFFVFGARRNLPDKEFRYLRTDIAYPLLGFRKLPIATEVVSDKFLVTRENIIFENHRLIEI
jgi:hypothetical protein